MTGNAPTVTDPVHGYGDNTADRWGGWSWREPSRGEHFRRCSFCGSIHPEDLAAETPGGNACLACGLAGWDACFRGQGVGVSVSVRDGILADPTVDEATKAKLRADTPAHSYNPGGWYASWADRKYGYPHKFYVEQLPNRDPGTLYVVGSANHDNLPRDSNTWYRWGDLTPELKAAAERDGYGARPDYPPPRWVSFGTHPTHHAKFYTVHLADLAISDEVKEQIAQVSGLRFSFPGDGRIAWEAVSRPAQTEGASDDG